jgi:hypothetical protein
MTHSRIGAKGMRSGAQGFVSSGHTETARDDTRDSARSTRVGDGLQVSRPQREGELFYLRVLRPSHTARKPTPASASNDREQGCRKSVVSIPAELSPRGRARLKLRRNK